MRTNLFVVPLIATLLFCSRCGQVQAAAPERPNILFIFGDDCGIDSFGCYGSDRAKSFTTHIDALAKSGVRYDRRRSPGGTKATAGRFG